MVSTFLRTGRGSVGHACIIGAFGRRSVAATRDGRTPPRRGSKQNPKSQNPNPNKIPKLKSQKRQCCELGQLGLMKFLSALSWILFTIVAAAGAAELPVRQGLVIAIDASAQAGLRREASLPPIGNLQPVDFVLDSANGEGRRGSVFQFRWQRRLSGNQRQKQQR